MRIECLHGYFKFMPERAKDVPRLNSLLRANLVKQGDYFTFEKLKDAPEYVIQGGMYLDTLAAHTHAGKPWEIMRANDIVFDFTQNLSVLKATVVRVLEVRKSRFNFFLNGLIVPGSVTTQGRVLSYSGFVTDDLRFYYDWLEYE